MTVKTNIATAVSIALLAVAGSATAEVTLYDYTEATSAYEDAYINGNFQANDNEELGQTSYSASVDFDYGRVFSSPSRDITVNADAAGAITRSGEAGAGSVSTFSAGIDGQVSNYFQPGSKEAFWFAKGDLGVQKDAEDPESSITAGLGYGRVVNATPMAKTLRLVEALREQGFLKIVPSKASHQQVANIISRESEYQSKYGFDSYQQYLFADIEQALGQGSLGAGAVIKAYDVLENESFSSRRIGWIVQAGVGIELSNFAGNDSGDPQIELRAEYHKPLDTRTQFSNEAELSVSYGDDTNYDFDNVMSYTYELTDTIDWENSWTLTHDDASGSGNESFTNNTLASAFRFELDNQLDFGITATLTKLDGVDDVDAALSANVGYRLR